MENVRNAYVNMMCVVLGDGIHLNITNIKLKKQKAMAESWKWFFKINEGTFGHDEVKNNYKKNLIKIYINKK